MKKMQAKINRGFCVQTKNGHAFDPLVGKISQIDLDDIAHALSNLCRYSGHCKKFYSVAEHSVLVSRIVRKLWPNDLEAIWAALLHDATEAYVGDLTTPLKVLMPKFMDIEDSLAADIAEKFKVKWNRRTMRRVKIGDLTALSTEARLLFADVSHWDTIKSYESQEEELHPKFPLGPSAAKKLFIFELAKIKGEIENGKRKKKRV